ncbi:hypothetical protein ACFO1B_42375 [Dactylosporangium siamense]|uniref:Lipoprotein n=1 Tax=Dactylosporangium siamense TaxID=685454 RepID=A0A919UGY5_9ACTN|nr:hypothetical protein [Dactylosporangium siamense]GIG51070.1 hypothetical protein Dsi01nite_091110 [Dactylosporangium siamense]
MRTFRKLGAAVVVTVTLALAGACGGTGEDKTAAGSSGKPSTAPSLSPADALTASVKDIGSTPYAFSLKADTFKLTGSVDATNSKLLVNASMEILTVEVATEGRVDGKDWFIKQSQGPDAFENKWVHLDPAKLKEGSVAFGVEDVKDPAGIKALVGAMTATEKTADGTIKGTLDLAKIEDVLLYVDPTVVMDVPDKVKALPFQAKLDSSGRLAGLTFEVPGTDGDPATPVAYAFTDWGKAVAVEKPAGAIEATDEIYKYFNLER